MVLVNLAGACECGRADVPPTAGQKRVSARRRVGQADSRGGRTGGTQGRFEPEVQFSQRGLEQQAH